jgi:hypothetical protein
MNMAMFFLHNSHKNKRNIQCRYKSPREEAREEHGLLAVKRN